MILNPQDVILGALVHALCCLVLVTIVCVTGPFARAAAMSPNDQWARRVVDGLVLVLVVLAPTGSVARLVEPKPVPLRKFVLWSIPSSAIYGCAWALLAPQ